MRLERVREVRLERVTFSVYVHICRDFKLKRFHQYFTNHLKFWIDDRIKLFDDGMWKAVKQAEVSEDAASHMHIM